MVKRLISGINTLFIIFYLISSLYKTINISYFYKITIPIEKSIRPYILFFARKNHIL